VSRDRIDLLLPESEEVEEKSPNAPLHQLTGHSLVAGTMPTASASVSNEDDAKGGAAA